MYFALKCASGVEESHTEHLRTLPLFILPHFTHYNTVTCKTGIKTGPTKVSIAFFLNQT